MTERRSTRDIMVWVVAALMPALLTSGYWFGWQILTQAGIAVATALMTELICLRLRGAPINAVGDGSAVVTALLITMALPPTTPPGVTVCATVLAISLGKHAFGGLGQNLFNPAMVGYAMVLVSFPAALVTWPVPADAVSGATLLEVIKHDHGRTLAELQRDPVFGDFGAWGFEWIALAALAGGVLLLARGLLAWRVSVGVLVTCGLLAVVLHDSGSSDSLGTPIQHWLSGGLILAAFFVATDPVTHPRSHTAQWLFALVVGCTIMAIRGFGNFPDGIAFAILLGNACTPWLDRRWP